MTKLVYVIQAALRTLDGRIQPNKMMLEAASALDARDEYFRIAKNSGMGRPIGTTRAILATPEQAKSYRERNGDLAPVEPRTTPALPAPAPAQPKLWELPAFGVVAVTAPLAIGVNEK